MGIDRIIFYTVVLFMVLGGLDKVIGNKFGLGKQFDEAVNAMGAIVLSVTGIICFSPVLAAVLKPIIVPIYKLLGADPSMFASTILALDMGGANLALKLADNTDAGVFSAFIVGAMLGPTIVFSIPVAIGIIDKEDQKYLALGLACGIITIPIGAFFGGVASGYSILFILKNLVPIIIISVLLSFGLVYIRDIVIKVFNIFSKILVIFTTLGLVIVMFEALTGINFIKLKIDGEYVTNLPITDSINITLSVIMVLAGSFPLIYVITKIAYKPLNYLGSKIGMNEIGVAGIISSLANNIPMFNMMKNMDSKSKIINSAFTVSAAFTFGDHMAFTTGYSNGEYIYMIFPMIVAKLVGGITAIIVAYFVSKLVLKNNNK